MKLDAFMGSAKLQVAPSDMYSLYAGYDYLSGDQFHVHINGGLGLILKAYMMSYGLPIRDSLGEVVGVINADVTIDTLASIVNSVTLYPHSTCALMTQSGASVVTPPTKPKGKCHVFSEAVDGKRI